MERTLDRPCPGVVIAQPRAGFRYGAEAFWLAGFALEAAQPSSALDLGTGSGILAFLLAARGVEVHGVDANARWRPLWAESLQRSSTPGRVRLTQHDISEPLADRCALVVSNPPFFASGTGPTSPDPWKRAARTESTATLARFVSAAMEALMPGGRACFVVPIERAAEVRSARAHLSRRLRVGARRVLLELVEGTGDLVEDQQISETSARARSWYSAVGAVTGRP